MTNNELLLAMSDMLDTKLKPIDDRLKKIENTQDGEILPQLRELKTTQDGMLPRLQRLETEVHSIKKEQKRVNLIIENEIRSDIKLLCENYVPAAKHFEKSSSKIESMDMDIDVLKKVVTEHSQKLQRIS